MLAVMKVVIDFFSKNPEWFVYNKDSQSFKQLI